MTFAQNFASVSNNGQHRSPSTIVHFIHVDGDKVSDVCRHMVCSWSNGNWRACSCSLNEIDEKVRTSLAAREQLVAMHYGDDRDRGRSCTTTDRASYMDVVTICSVSSPRSLIIVLSSILYPTLFTCHTASPQKNSS